MLPRVVCAVLALLGCVCPAARAATTCNAGQTQAGITPPLKRIRAFHDQYLYKIEFTTAGDVTTAVGGDGGSPTDIDLTSLLSAGEYITTGLPEYPLLRG